MNYKNKVLLDASALMVLFRKEQGYDVVGDVIHKAVINVVNLAEVSTVLTRYGMSLDAVTTLLSDFEIEAVSLTKSVALQAGGLYQQTKEFGLSLGDRVCLACAESLSLPIYTTDKQWAQVQQFVSVPIKFVR